LFTALLRVCYPFTLFVCRCSRLLVTDFTLPLFRLFRYVGYVPRYVAVRCYTVGCSDCAFIVYVVGCCCPFVARWLFPCVARICPSCERFFITVVVGCCPLPIYHHTFTVVGCCFGWLRIAYALLICWLPVYRTRVVRSPCTVARVGYTVTDGCSTGFALRCCRVPHGRWLLRRLIDSLHRTPFVGCHRSRVCTRLLRSRLFPTTG